MTARRYRPQRGDVLDILPAPGLVRVERFGKKVSLLQDLTQPDRPAQRWTWNQWADALRKAERFEVRTS